MNQDRLNELVREIAGDALSLLSKKGCQYAPDDDAFAAFDNPVTTTDISIFLRAHNKYKRLEQLFRTTEVLMDAEAREDTVLDLINYLLLLLAYYRHADSTIQEIMNEVDKTND